MYSATTPFSNSLYPHLLLFHAESIQTHKNIKKKTHHKRKKKSFVQSRGRPGSWFCGRYNIRALWENLADHKGIYLCTLGANTIFHSCLDIGQILHFSSTHYFSGSTKFDGYCLGSWKSPLYLQSFSIFLQQHSTLTMYQVPKYISLKLDTLGWMYFRTAVRNAAQLWSGPHLSTRRIKKTTS